MLKLENSIRGLSFSRVAFDLTIQDTNKTCPICKGKMYFVNEKFKAPKKSNDKEWKIIEYLLLSGYDFRNPIYGTERYMYFEFPKNLQEAEAFVREMRKL